MSAIPLGNTATSRSVRAAARGYVALAATYMGGVLIARSFVDAAPFDPAGGDLTRPWVMVLLPNSVVAAAVAGWTCRRAGGDRRATALLIAILVGLALLVVLIEALVGPTPTARAFVERLIGPTPADFPFSEFFDGRPQPWFAVASYALAILAILAGSRFGSQPTEALDDT